MSPLHRKLVRDFLQMKGQALAISLVIACGVATFVMSLSTLGSLRRTMDTYYARYRFADVFAHLKRAPASLVARIEELPGVARVETRIVEHVTLDVEGLAEPAVGRLVSVPAHPGPELNDRYLRSGRELEPTREGEVLVSEGFANALHLGPGNAVRAVINGRKRALRIVGVALGPEFVYQIREGEILPDDVRYAVLWVGERELAAAFDMEGAFNDVSLALEPEANEPEVIRRLDLLLAPYGGLGAYGRADQASHKFLSNELEELRGMAVFIPSIFLGVAAFLLHVVIGRVVGLQREQIAMLKAFGYTPLEVGRHFLELVLVIVLVGVVLGGLVGAQLGRGVTEMYTRFFHFPVLSFVVEGWVLGLAILLSAGSGIAATAGAIRRAVRVPPAQAMRPEPPARYRPTILERLGGAQLLTPASRMILRHLERQPIRSLLSILGIALACAMLVLGNFMVDALDHVMETQFAVGQRQDVNVAFVEPQASSAIPDLMSLPGVVACEPYRSLPVRVRVGPRSRRLGLMALEPAARLYRVVDVHRRVIPLPAAGVVLSEKLAQVLGVGIGDRVTLEILEGRRPVRTVAVAGLVADFTGIAAYMARSAANRLMEEGDVLSGGFLAVDGARLNDLYRELKSAPRVASVAIKKATLESFRATVAENLLRMRSFNVIFAGIIAFGVVYNNARIALSERSRELATLRVIGYTRAEISMILLGELAILTAVAIPAGLAIGYGLAAWVVQGTYDTELFRIPLVVGRFTFAFAAAVTALAALVSGLVVRGRLDRLDLVGVLKSRE